LPPGTSLLADEWNSVNARLKQASTSTEDFSPQRPDGDKPENRHRIQRQCRTVRPFSSMREFGYSSAEVLKVTEAVSTGLKLSGASTAEASSVITQLSQALAQGVLRGRGSTL
jgi:hypothetical protein